MGWLWNASPPHHSWSLHRCSTWVLCNAKVIPSLLPFYPTNGESFLYHWRKGLKIEAYIQYSPNSINLLYTICGWCGSLLEKCGALVFQFFSLHYGDSFGDFTLLFKTLKIAERWHFFYARRQNKLSVISFQTTSEGRYRVNVETNMDSWAICINISMWLQQILMQHSLGITLVDSCIAYY